MTRTAGGLESRTSNARTSGAHANSASSNSNSVAASRTGRAHPSASFVPLTDTPFHEIQVRKDTGTADAAAAGATGATPARERLSRPYPFTIRNSGVSSRRPNGGGARCAGSGSVVGSAGGSTTTIALETHAIDEEDRASSSSMDLYPETKARPRTPYGLPYVKSKIKYSGFLGNDPDGDDAVNGSVEVTDCAGGAGVEGSGEPGGRGATAGVVPGEQQHEVSTAAIAATGALSAPSSGSPFQPLVERPTAVTAGTTSAVSKMTRQAARSAYILATASRNVRGTCANKNTSAMKNSIGDIAGITINSKNDTTNHNNSSSSNSSSGNGAGAGGVHACTCGGHANSSQRGATSATAAGPADAAAVAAAAATETTSSGQAGAATTGTASAAASVRSGGGGGGIGGSGDGGEGRRVGGTPSRLQLPTYSTPQVPLALPQTDEAESGFIPADLSGSYPSADVSSYSGGNVLTHMEQGVSGAGGSGVGAGGGDGGGGYGMHDGQGQALAVPPPPLAPLDRERFKAEAMELEAALKAREGGMNGRLEEGDASGQQLASARRLRSLLSSNREELIREALDRDWVPLLMGWLGVNTRPAVQVEALWALTNIAAGATDHAQVLTKSGAVPPLVVLLDSPNEEVLEQALWLLGNLAGEGAAARDAVLAVDALPPLVRCLERHQGSRSLLKIGSWTLSNLCDGQPRPVLDVHTVIPALSKLLQHTDSEILSHTCWALSHLCDGLSTHIRAVVDADICWRLVDLLMHRSWRVTKPALRTIGNIVCAEDDTDYTQHIINAGAVPCLQRLIAHSNREIQKEACWTLSNIAAGTVEQIQTVLDSGALPSLVQLASSQPADPADPDSGGADPEVRSEASWAVLNATSCGSDHQIEYLVQEGGIKVLGELLKQSSMVMMALEGLERILEVGDKEATRIMMGESSGGNAQGQSSQRQLQQNSQDSNKQSYDPQNSDPNQPQSQPRGNRYAALLQATKIELLETHKNSAVAKRAQRIRERYFVRCAICNQSSSKASQRTRFCPECKCDVCRDCDCTRFHLEFQEELWKEMSEQEANARATKKSKKQKKKQKAKERNKAAIASSNATALNVDTSTAPSNATTPRRSGQNGGSQGEDGSDSTAQANNTKSGNTESGEGRGGGSGVGDHEVANGVTNGNGAGNGSGKRDGEGGVQESQSRARDAAIRVRARSYLTSAVGQPGGNNGPTTSRPSPSPSPSPSVSSTKTPAQPSRNSPSGANSGKAGDGMGTVAIGDDNSRRVCESNGRAASAVAAREGSVTPARANGLTLATKNRRAGGRRGARAVTSPSPPALAGVRGTTSTLESLSRKKSSAGTTVTKSALSAQPASSARSVTPSVGTIVANGSASQGNPPFANRQGGVECNTETQTSSWNNGNSGTKGKGQRRARTSAGASSASSLPVSASASSPAVGGGSEKKPSTAAANSSGVVGGKGGSSTSGTSGLAGSGEGGIGKGATMGRSATGGGGGGGKKATERNVAARGSGVVSGGGSTSGVSGSGGGNNGNGKGRGKGDAPNKREGGGDEDSLRQNDNYVSFLNQTGSILALAQMLDRQSLEDAWLESMREK